MYNRPIEIQELLESLVKQSQKEFEVLIIEDGSSIVCEKVVASFRSQLNITYLYKQNTGPGDSRNFGMTKANGNYYLILDSDCILPPTYFAEVYRSLTEDYVDCFGGVDAALDSFTPVQKAINFAMTSVITTGGVRGASEKLGKFQPRSFNMGISKEAFIASGGFGRIHPGEDPDLSIRLWKLGFETRLFKNVFVYHKRRIDWGKFKSQVSKFGKVRPILDTWHPEYSKITYYFPVLFTLGLLLSILALPFGSPQFLILYLIYFLLCFVLSFIQNKSFWVAFLSVRAVYTQLVGYGMGFLSSFIKIRVQKKSPENAFPELFFKKV